MLLDGTDRFWHESVAEIGSDRPVTGRPSNTFLHCQVPAALSK